MFWRRQIGTTSLPRHRAPRRNRMQAKLFRPPTLPHPPSIAIVFQIVTIVLFCFTPLLLIRDGDAAPPQGAGHETASDQPFTGLWETDYGILRLRQEVGDVTVVYPWAGGTARLRGVADESNMLMFECEEPNGLTGNGTFILDSKDDSYSGTWAAETRRGGKWNGTRVVAREKVVWLIVLEAHWERGLADSEYSYGAMLRSFFNRDPSVHVRHRFVHDVAGLQRWCQEVVFLAEPVVLYFASQGTKEGLSIGRDVVDAKVLAACLEGVDNLELLHLGSCMVGGGSLPEGLHIELAESRRFPISGYAENADWAGSAVVDFAYLDLILCRGLSPSEAVKQTRRMITFAGSDPVAGTAIRAADLRLVKAPKH